MFPNYKHIELKAYGTLDIIDVLLESEINKAPCYIDLNVIPIKKIDEVLNNIEEAFKTIKLSIIAPYPFYLLCKSKISSKRFNTVPTRADLPSFYKTIPKSKLTSKQLGVARKCTNLCEKIKNESPSKSLKEFVHMYKDQRILMDLCCEIAYLEKIEAALSKEEEVV